MTTRPKPRHPTNPDAPQFTPQVWNNVDGKVASANCIAYSYAGSNPDGSNVVYNESIPQLGYTAGYFGITPDMVSGKKLRNLMEEEGIHWVGRKPIKSDQNHFEVPPNKPGYYLIGLYIKVPEMEHGQRVMFYHFVRQDADGGWSQKMNPDPVDRMLEPAEDGGYRDLPKRYGRQQDYQFAGYGYVPKHGIDAGLEQKLIPGILHGLSRDENICERYAPAIDFFAQNKSQPWGLWELSNISETMKKYNIPTAQEAFEACVTPYIQQVRPDFKKQSAVQKP